MKEFLLPYTSLYFMIFARARSSSYLSVPCSSTLDLRNPQAPRRQHLTGNTRATVPAACLRPFSYSQPDPVTSLQTKSLPKKSPHRGYMCGQSVRTSDTGHTAGICQV